MSLGTHAIITYPEFLISYIQTLDYTTAKVKTTSIMTWSRHEEEEVEHEDDGMTPLVLILMTNVRISIGFKTISSIDLSSLDAVIPSLSFQSSRLLSQSALS